MLRNIPPFIKNLFVSCTMCAPCHSDFDIDEALDHVFIVACFKKHSPFYHEKTLDYDLCSKKF